jgi:hypothetical protein
MNKYSLIGVEWELKNVSEEMGEERWICKNYLSIEHNAPFLLVIKKNGTLDFNEFVLMTKDRTGKFVNLDVTRLNPNALTLLESPKRETFLRRASSLVFYLYGKKVHNNKHIKKKDKTMKFFIYVLMLVTIALICYLGASFIEGSLDASTWGKSTRTNLLCFFTILLIIVSVFYIIWLPSDYEKEEVGNTNYK